jgi:hypothetical protein
MDPVRGENGSDRRYVAVEASAGAVGRGARERQRRAMKGGLGGRRRSEVRTFDSYVSKIAHPSGHPLSIAAVEVRQRRRER